MGTSASLPLSPVRSGFSTMCISFVYCDRITVLHLDEVGLTVIRQAILETWGSGIQNEQVICGSGWMFKLSGSPFTVGTSSQIAAQSRVMVCQILQKLYAIGWKITGSIDLGRFNDKSTVFFKNCSPEFSTLPFCCVGLSSTDKLQIVNLPAQLVEPVKESIHRTWTMGIQKEELVNGVLEVKLSGNPWFASDLQSVMAKLLLQDIIATLRRYQWSYYCNVNLKSTADSLIFRHDPNITFGESLQFCTISLNRTDRLRLISAPENIVAMIRKVITTTWVHGVIQEEREYHGSWEFKLSGNPWHSSREESVMARYLILKVLEAMLEQGWHNIAGIDINRKPTDKSVLIFQKREPKRSQIMCLSLNDIDKFRLINTPPEITDHFKQLLLARWLKGVQSEKLMTVSFGSVCQLKMSGCPWVGGIRNDPIHARSFLCTVLDEFAHRGWKLLLCADVSAKFVHQDKGPDYPIDLHSLWFIYEPDVTIQNAAPAYGFGLPSAPPQQYGLGMPSQPSAPLYGYGMATEPTEAPPSYMQATGGQMFSGK